MVLSYGYDMDIYVVNSDMVYIWHIVTVYNHMISEL